MAYDKRKLEAFVRLHPTAIQVLSRLPEVERFAAQDSERDRLRLAQSKPENFGTLHFSQIDGQHIDSIDDPDIFKKELSEDERQMAGLIITKAEHEQVF